MLLRLDAPCQTPYGSDALGSRYQGDLFPTPCRSCQDRKERLP
jgi:hypothetical protein